MNITYKYGDVAVCMYSACICGTLRDIGSSALCITVIDGWDGPLVGMNSCGFYLRIIITFVVRCVAGGAKCN